jgi:hypothetical protein
MVQSFNDMAQNLRNVIPQTLAGLNEDIAKAVTGHGSKQDFSDTLTGAGRGLISAGLQRAEGGILQKFGLGKRDGSSALQALWVQLANSTAGLSTHESDGFIDSRQSRQHGPRGIIYSAVLGLGLEIRGELPPSFR